MKFNRITCPFWKFRSIVFRCCCFVNDVDVVFNVFDQFDYQQIDADRKRHIDRTNEINIAKPNIHQNYCEKIAQRRFPFEREPSKEKKESYCYHYEMLKVTPFELR